MNNLLSNQGQPLLATMLLLTTCLSASFSSVASNEKNNTAENGVDGQVVITVTSKGGFKSPQAQEKSTKPAAVNADNEQNKAAIALAKQQVKQRAKQLKLSSDVKKGKTREQIISMKQAFTSANTTIEAASDTAKNLMVNTVNNDAIQLANAMQANAKQARYYYSFNIYDAFSELIYDIDGDGYFREFSVIFDPDIITSDGSQAHATVYAELYLSYQGGPWQHYFSTEDFNIYGVNTDDEYEVTSTLHQGYASGEYDVLIDLYEAGYADIVATISADDINSLYALPLESSEYDQNHQVQIIESSGSGGSFGILSGLFLLAALVCRQVLAKTLR